MSQYIRCVKENRRVEYLITLKDWTAEEAEYQIQATEIKPGLKSGNRNGKLHDRRNKSFGINQTDDKKKGTCKACGARHAVWNCDVFKSRSKKLGLCYRCLGDDHLGGVCLRSRVCNIDGCRDRRSRLLHGNRNDTRRQFSPLGSQPHGTRLQGNQSQGIQPQGSQPKELSHRLTSRNQPRIS